MTVLASDNFNRADANPIGAPWVQLTGNNLEIVSNKVDPVSSFSDAMAAYGGVSYPNDGYVQATVAITGGAAGDGPGVMFRGSASPGVETGYRCVVCKVASNNVELGYFNAGTFNFIANRTTTWVDGDTLRVEFTGTTIKLFQNGVQLGADITDASAGSGSSRLAHSGDPGLTGVFLDDFEAGTTGGGGGPLDEEYDLCITTTR